MDDPAALRGVQSPYLVARANALVGGAFAALLAVLVAVSFGAPTASAHGYGWGSVDSNYWVHYTDYYTQYAPAALNAAAGEWNVVAGYYEYQGAEFSYDYYEEHLDLYGMDYYSESTVYAYWTNSPGADEIYINGYHMDPYYAGISTYDQKRVLTHELGHALGFSDLYDDYWYYHSVMYGYPFPLYDYPFDHDYYDYQYSWV